MVIGAGWMLLLRLADRGLAVASTIVLARLLLPADFGLVAMATSISGTLSLLSAFGFDFYLIQHEKPRNSDFDTAWTMKLLLGILVAALVLLLTAPAAAFYAEPRLNQILPIIAVASAVMGFENPAVVRLLKDLNYSKEFSFRFAQRVLRFVAVVGLALYFESYWALVYGTLVGSVIAVVLSFIVVPYRPSISFANVRDMMRFTKWLLASNLLNYLRTRGSDFIIGRVQGPAMLGAFNVGYEVATLPTTELAAGLNRAVYPAFIRMRDEAHGQTDTGGLKKGFLGVVGVMTLLTLPAGVGLSLLAPQLVPVLLGDKWASATPIVQLLAIQGSLAAIAGCCSYVFMAMDQARMMAIVGAVQIPALMVLMAIMTLQMGVIGAAYAHVIIAMIALPVPYLILSRRLDISWRELLNCSWRSVCATAVMAACVANIKGWVGRMRSSFCPPVQTPHPPSQPASALTDQRKSTNASKWAVQLDEVQDEPGDRPR